jgi:prepilin-type N-terminal cleavage/methylation domain-containing protein
MPRASVHSRRAFSFLETMVVVVIIGIIAATATPAFSLLRNARRVDSAQEVERTLLLARSLALATGRPTAVEFSANNMRILTINSLGTSPTPVLAPDGSTRGSTRPDQGRRDPWITSLTDGAGNTTTTTTAWFGIDGTPELRDTSGTRIGPWTTDMSIRIDNTFTITVRRITGSVQRQ